jgi:hypothetical protein
MRFYSAPDVAVRAVARRPILRFLPFVDLSGPLNRIIILVKQATYDKLVMALIANPAR